MNNSYHILWIDDEWESMTSFIKNCKLRHNLELHPYKTQKEGLDAFGENQVFWDAIILDAKVLDENEHEVANIGSLYKAVARLQTEFKDIPYFVSTGQPDLTKAEHFEAFCKTTYSQRYYEKVVDDEQLCLDIIKAADEKSQRKIINKYPEIFSWLPSELYSELVYILSIIENGENRNTNAFNSIRKVLDWVMGELNNYGILSINFSGTNLNECSKLLANSDLQEFVPQYIQRQIHSCCTIANEGSHRLISDNDVRNGIAPFLTRSTTFELLNILMWMHQLPQEPQFDDELRVWHCGDTMLGLKTWKGGNVILFKKNRNISKNPIIQEKYPYFAKYKKI